jgi:hypothetical protein
MYMSLESNVRGIIDEALRQLVIAGEVRLRIISADGTNVRLEVESYRNQDDHGDGQPDDSTGTAHPNHSHGTAESACPQ